LEEYSSQLEEANEQLKKHDRMQKEFINIAAHELRTPIQPILMIASTFDIGSKKAEEEEEEEEEEEDTQEKVLISKQELRLIARNAQRLERLSADILDATRIESGMLKLNKQQVDIVALVSDAIEDARRQVKARDSVEFVVSVPTEPVTAEVDGYRIRQVLANLVNNAIKFTEKGTITISLEKKKKADGSGQEELQVSVSDTGRGIDPEIRPRLFQKFAGKSELGTSTGLGLYICKAIIEAHGGKIWAEDNNREKGGEGATFAFTLPASRGA
ncbi:MAG: HAMP domain-containing sensor histidine kinase, partial [Thermoproteota archaeon]